MAALRARKGSKAFIKKRALGPVSRKTRLLLLLRNHIFKSVSRKAGRVPTSNEVHFVYLADNFTVKYI